MLMSVTTISYTYSKMSKFNYPRALFAYAKVKIYTHLIISTHTAFKNNQHSIPYRTIVFIGINVREICNGQKSRKN